MAALSFAQMRTRQNRRLKDPTDITFTSSEKDEFLTTAIADPYVFDITRDTSITTAASTASYDLSGLDITEVTDIGIDMVGDGYPEPITRDGYDIIDGTLYFEGRYRGVPADKTLYITGKRKLTASNSIPEFLQEYVLRLADINAYEELIASFTTRFLKNDVTMSGLQSTIRGLQIRVSDLRKNLANRREIRG